MNIFKSSILALVGLSTALTFTACSDDDDPNVTGELFDVPGAYFKPQYDNEVILGETDTEFNVPVYREGTQGSSSASISFTCTSTAANSGSVFTIPSQVTFADGENVAQIPVSFIATDFEPVIPYELHITVADGKETPYTLNTVNYMVTFVPWTDLGECDYTDYFVRTFFKVGEPTYKVKVQEHPQMPGLYRLLNPYGEVYPYNEPGDYDASQDHWMYINATDPNAVFFSDRNGKPAHFYSGMNWGYGEFVMTNIATLRLAQNNPSAAEGNYGTLKNGIIWFPNTLCAMLNYNDGGLYSTEMESDQYTVILPGAELPKESWKVLGEGEYTDAFISPIYGLTTPPYKVQVEQSEENPGMIRILNPYTNAFPDGTPGDEDIYITFNVTNPDCVYVPIQVTGIIDDADGPVSILNYAQLAKLNGKDDAFVIESGKNDTFKDGVITFKAGDCLIYLSDAEKPGPYGAKEPIEGKLVLPTSATQAIMSSLSVKALSNGTAHFDLRGVKGSFTPLKSIDGDIHFATRKLSR